MKRHWRNNLYVVAALVLESEKNGKSLFKTVMFTMGTKWKNEIDCSFLRGNGKKLWDICDGHAEALCYRLASVYMLSEIYKIDNHHEDSSIFQIAPTGYELKESKKLHLFISYHPCGFMKKLDDKTFWKQFSTSPHIPNCSSKILIGAYLGIQGPLSCLLTKPVYISSMVLLDGGEKDFLTISDIKQVFEKFSTELAATTYEQTSHESIQHDGFFDRYCSLAHHRYHLKIPEINIIKPSNIKELFPTLCSPKDAKKAKMGFILPDLINVNNDYLFKQFDIHNCNDIQEILQNYVTDLKGKIKIKVSPSTQEVRYNILTVAIGRLQHILKIAKNNHVNCIKKFRDEKRSCYNRKIDEMIINLQENKEKFQNVDTLSDQTAVNNARSEVQKCNNTIVALNNLDGQIILNKVDCDWARYIYEMKVLLYYNTITV